jgi:hypothetical protein
MTIVKAFTENKMSIFLTLFVIIYCAISLGNAVNFHIREKRKDIQMIEKNKGLTIEKTKKLTIGTIVTNLIAPILIITMCISCGLLSEDKEIGKQILLLLVASVLCVLCIFNAIHSITIRNIYVENIDMNNKNNIIVPKYMNEGKNLSGVVFGSSLTFALLSSIVSLFYFGNILISLFNK